MKSFLIIFYLIYFVYCQNIDKIFDTLDGWTDGSQNVVTKQYQVDDGNLRMKVQSSSEQRPKIYLKDRKFKNPGRHRWRTYLPRRTSGEKASIGMFLYHDDYKELDFEIGYGSVESRKGLGAKDNQLVVHCVTQSISGTTHKDRDSYIRKLLINADNWYDFSIDLDVKNEKYNVTWWINDTPVHNIYHYWGPDDIGDGFDLFVSLENLRFMNEGYQVTKNNKQISDVLFSKYQHRIDLKSPPKPM